MFLLSLIVIQWTQNFGRNCIIVQKLLMIVEWKIFRMHSLVINGCSKALSKTEKSMSTKFLFHNCLKRFVISFFLKNQLTIWIKKKPNNFQFALVFVKVLWKYRCYSHQLPVVSRRWRICREKKSLPSLWLGRYLWRDLSYYIAFELKEKTLFQQHFCEPFILTTHLIVHLTQKIL